MLILNIVKLSIVFKLIYGFNAVLIKVLTRLFLDTNKIYSKIYMEKQKKLENLKQFLKIKNKVGGISQ